MANPPVIDGQKYVAAGPPPTDSIKLFVGQVPKSMGERELIPIFSEIGEVYELAVLRDKETNRHRGCAFVTYYDRDHATTAVVEFHDKKKLSPTVGFMQVKPASDCKIFVGNLPLDVKVETVNAMFSKFGAVDEVHLIRDHRGEFKGCAFVRYRSKSDAVTAIQRLNESKNLKGATANLIVRFADGHRSISQMSNGMSNGNARTGTGMNNRSRNNNNTDSNNDVIINNLNTLDEAGLALANWLSNVIGVDARQYAENFVRRGFRSINDIALLNDEVALRKASVDVSKIVSNPVHRIRIIQASSMVLPPSVSADQLNNLKRWLEMTVSLDRSDADRAARRLAAAGFLEMSDLMMLANTTLCESAGVNISKLVPNFAHRLKIIAAIQQGMLQQSQVGGLGAQVANSLNVGGSTYSTGANGASGLGVNGASSSNWRSPTDPGLTNPVLSGNTSSAWLPHGNH
jgi:hypothetical protein